jgi:signal transduction histidine kinase
MMRRLRPGVLDNLGLIEALKDEIDAWNSRNIETHCDFNYSGELESLDEYSNIMLYRIVQEGLTNITKHASAGHVQIEMKQAGQSLQLIINDNGKGIDLHQAGNIRGLGLIGMRERVETIEGVFNIESAPGKGFCIRITVPLNKVAEQV